MKDIAISKLNAITERLAKKDFIDLYFLHEQLDLVKVFNDGFFKVFPLQKTKSVLKSLASVTDVMSSKSTPMPKILDSKSFDIEKMNHVIHLVAAKCCESCGLMHLKKQLEIKRLEQQTQKKQPGDSHGGFGGKNEKKD